jgi:hypothetical protein
MSWVKVHTLDNDALTINTQQVAFHKFHPTERKPAAGYIMCQGRELFLTLASYNLLLNELDKQEVP